MNFSKCRVKPGSKVDLKDWDPDDKSASPGSREEDEKRLQELATRIDELQELLYAESKRGVLVVLQGMLGMWTVTLLLKPLIVVGHLLGGLTIAALSWWNLLEIRHFPRQRGSGRLRIFAGVVLIVLALQIFLGGWTSSNYAALACTDFPKCQGQWWPTIDLKNAFVLWRGLGINYEFGVLGTPARTAIHLCHRYWAAVVSTLMVALILYTLRVADAHGKRIAWCILGLLSVQISLGVSNVLGGLPLLVAVMHNAVAALLLLSVVTLLRYSTSSFNHG